MSKRYFLKFLLSFALFFLLTGSASTVTFAAPTYTFQTGAAAIVVGATDSGSHCDDCVTGVTLPFSYNFHGVGYTTVNVGSNGNVQFTGNSTFALNGPLPDFHFTNTILAMQNDLRTDQAGGGIYTSISGAAPNRIFNIEWRAVLFSNTSQSVNFEVRLFEGLNRFEIIYGSIAVNGSQQTVGVQKDNTDFTQFENNTAGTLFAGLQLIATTTPTAASASVSGRVLTANGNGLRNAVVRLTGQQGATQSVRSSSFGYYRFDDVQAGETYIISVSSKRYRFISQIISVADEITELNLVAEG